MESDQTIVEHLEEDKKLLEAEIVSLNSKIEILSDTINKKVVEEMDLIEKFEKQSTPLLLPLAGSAKLEEISQEEPSCIFSGVEGTTIIATGTGTVKEIIEDEIYGTKVTIEHDNGYESIYQNNGNVLVKVGDTIMQGAALFVVTADNATFKEILEICN